MIELMKEFAERSRALAAKAEGPMRDRLLRLAEQYDERAGKKKLTPASLAMRIKED